MHPWLCKAMLSPFGSLFPTRSFYLLALLFPHCLVFTSFLFSPHFLPSGLFPPFGLPMNLLAWWFCAPLPTCALWPQQMLPITVRNMPSISPLILKRLKVHLSLPSSAPFPCGCQPTSTKCQLGLTHRETSVAPLCSEAEPKIQGC